MSKNNRFKKNNYPQKAHKVHTGNIVVNTKDIHKLIKDKYLNLKEKYSFKHKGQAS